MIINIREYTQPDHLVKVGKLTSLIIEGMQKQGTVRLVNKEAFSCHTNGLFDLLDQLCDFWQWPKSSITVETTNPLESHSEYNVVLGSYRYELFKKKDRLLTLKGINHKSWNHSKDYGLFIGRPNSTRLRALENHFNSPLAHRGISSFHGDINKTHPGDMLTYLVQTNNRRSALDIIQPHSDIGELMPIPIVPPAHIIGWESVYEQIGIEIVCETAETTEYCTISEKVWRPMLYKRPFLLISGRHSLSRLSEAEKFYPTAPGGCMLFDDIIPIASYDYLEGIARVDKVFEILHDLIQSGRIHTILEDCKVDIEHNYNFIMDTFVWHHDNYDR